jgi:hypothetical protein
MELLSRDLHALDTRLSAAAIHAAGLTVISPWLGRPSPSLKLNLTAFSLSQLRLGIINAHL